MLTTGIRCEVNWEVFERGPEGSQPGVPNLKPGKIDDHVITQSTPPKVLLFLTRILATVLQFGKMMISLHLRTPH